MNKGYFFVKPSQFVRLGDIDIDGNFEYCECEDFDVEESKENYLIFEVKYDETENGKEYARVCREKITGEVFDLDIESKVSKRTGTKVSTVILSSENLGLFSKIMPVSSIEDKPSRVSGLFYHFLDNPENRINYCKNLRNMFEEAKAYKYIYDHSIDGPSRYLSNQMKKSYRKSRR